MYQVELICLNKDSNREEVRTLLCESEEPSYIASILPYNISLIEITKVTPIVIKKVFSPDFQGFMDSLEELYPLLIGNSKVVDGTALSVAMLTELIYIDLKNYLKGYNEKDLKNLRFKIEILLPVLGEEEGEVIREKVREYLFEDF